MAKGTDKVYSLLNVTNGCVLSAKLNSVSTWNKETGTILTRRRNWKLSQFQQWGPDILDYFINAAPMSDPYHWSMGTHEIWVKEEDIDELYTMLGLATLRNFCSWDKQQILFGAFLFHKDPKMFLESDLSTRKDNAKKMMKDLKCGKEFMEFLEAFGVLSFQKREYNSQTHRAEETHKYFFSSNELELISRERKEIITTFEYTVKK